MSDLKIISIFVPHKGCPHDCHFCNQKKITGVRDDFDDLELVKTIEESISTIKSKNIEIAFYGGSFTGIEHDTQEKYLSIANKYIQQGKVRGIRLSTRPDYIDDEILTLLKKYGVTTIELGVQSLDDTVLYKSNRGNTEEDVVKASKLIKAYGFTLGHQIMVGLPEDSFDKFKQTIKKSIELQPDIVRIYPVLVIRDTELESMYNNSSYESLSIEDAVEFSAYAYGRYVQKGIKVIRIGLQASDNISEDKDVVSGPFHPAFRQLVETFVYKESLFEFLNHQGIEINNKDILIKVNLKEISNFIGINKSLKLELIDRFKLKSLKVQGDRDIDRASYKLLFDDKTYHIDRFNVDEV